MRTRQWQAASRLPALAVLLLLLFQPANADRGAQAEAIPPYVEPGVLDVQAWDWLQQDLGKMVDDTETQARQRLSPGSFQTRYVDATITYLELDEGTMAVFRRTVAEALGEIGDARRVMLSSRFGSEPGLAMTDSMANSQARSDRYARAQRHAARLPLAVLESRPRHQLLREQMLKWLLGLDYGISAASR